MRESKIQGNPGPKRVQTQELSKNFQYDEEESIYSWWEAAGYFRPKSDGSKKSQIADETYTIVMPPPNVTGRLHMGHAMFATLQDILIRFNRMQGKNTLWLPGTDHAGIATQAVVEKQLSSEGLTRTSVGRDKFNQRIWEWKSTHGDIIQSQLRRMGASCDWSRERFTLDEGLSHAVNEAFIRLFEKDLVYRGVYMVNWSPKLMTAVSDLEVEYVEENGHLYHFKYPLEGSDDFIPVATTRPETIFGDSALAVNPNDDRYKKYIGRNCIVPEVNRKIQIIADEYVDMEFGSGALKITPAHDQNDYQIGQKHNLQQITILNWDCKLNENCGKYEGLDRFECRKVFWADLEKQGIAIRKESYKVRAPRSQRGGEIIEPMLSTQWFVKMDSIAQKAIDSVRKDEIKFIPNRFQTTFMQWMSNIKDWCVSRQLWWGHRIPIYYLFKSKQEFEASIDKRSDQFIAAKNSEEAHTKAKEKFGHYEILHQESDVLDTWFSSGLWPFSTLGWPDTDAPDYKQFYPTQLLETGYDIIFFWVCRMIMMGLEFTGKAPFSLVILHGLVRDDKGRKMSKTLGNVTDPLSLISEVGTDAMRFTLATGTTLELDLNLSMEKIKQGQYLTNKIWNAAKFALFALGPQPYQNLWDYLKKVDYSGDQIQQLPLSEKWIVSIAHQAVDSVSTNLDNQEFSLAGNFFQDYFWYYFADWYIEACKTRLKDLDQSTLNQLSQDEQHIYEQFGVGLRKLQALGVLFYCLKIFLKLGHPFMPYVTEKLYQALPHKDEALITSPWPSQKASKDQAALENFKILQEIVTKFRSIRQEYGVEDSKRIAATLVIQQQNIANSIQQDQEVIASLSRLDPQQFQIKQQESNQNQFQNNNQNLLEIPVRGGIELQIPMSGLVDYEKEIQRLNKEKQKINSSYDKLVNQLNNKQFTKKASEQYINKVRQQAKIEEEKLHAIIQKQESVEKLQKA